VTFRDQAVVASLTNKLIELPLLSCPAEEHLQ